VRSVRLLIWCAGAAFSATLIVGAIHGSVLPTSQAIAGYGIAAFFTITIGLLVWELRPESRTGILVAAIPFAGMLNDLNRIFPSSRLAVTIGWGASYLAAPLMAQAILSYPSGRLTSRLDRICVAALYAHAAAYGLLFMLFYSPRSPIEQDIWSCPSCAVPYTHVAWLNLIATSRAFDKAVLALALVALALLARKLVRGSPGARPVVLPLGFAAGVIVAQYSVQIALYGHSVNSWTHPTWFWITTAAPLSIPVALAAGLLWRGGGRGPVAGLVVELERTPPARSATRSHGRWATARSSSRCGCRSAERTWMRMAARSRYRSRRRTVPSRCSVPPTLRSPRSCTIRCCSSGAGY
jgi:hypothetical protein